MTQTGFASLAYLNKQRRTGRERFPAEIDAVVAWRRLLDRIEPHYPKVGSRKRFEALGQTAQPLVPQQLS